MHAEELGKGPNASVNITVLIASRNRAVGLRRTLESLFCPTNLRAENWEALVIVDCDCRDGSAQVCEEFAAKFPNHFRALVQENRGKSNALNFGISVAKGDILALTDDDVLVDPAYIQGVRTFFERYPAHAAQGRILLDCEGGLPSWMPPRMKSFVGSCDFGDEVQEWTETRHTLFGTNMAVRTDSARSIGGFAPELGAGTSVGYCEDTEFSLRLRQAGCRIFYAPQIAVRHQLSRGRLTRPFFRKRYFGFGRSQAYYVPRPDVALWRYGYWETSYALSKALEAFRHFCTNRPADALNAQCCALERMGLVVQHCHFKLGKPHRLSYVSAWPEMAKSTSVSEAACCSQPDD